MALGATPGLRVSSKPPTTITSSGLPTAVQPTQHVSLCVQAGVDVRGGLRRPFESPLLVSASENVVLLKIFLHLRIASGEAAVVWQKEDRTRNREK